jgi:hypothetical protein
MAGASGNPTGRVSVRPASGSTTPSTPLVLDPSVAAAATLGVTVTPAAPSAAPATSTTPDPTNRVTPQPSPASADAPAAAAAGEPTPAGQATARPSLPEFITTGDANGVLQRLLDDSRYPGNPLSDFDQVAYHFRLFAVPDAVTLTPSLNNLSAINQITIAESGVTAGYVIKDVQMESIVAPNYRTRNVNLTDITITIEEPLGVSFIDAMATACASLSVANFQRAVYGFELTFRAYARDGSIADLSQLPNGGKWVWLLTFQDLETSLTSNGGSYVLKGKPYEEQIFEEARYLRINETMNVSGATVGAFLNNLARAMTEGWRNRYGTNGPATDIVTFEFKTHPVLYPRPAGDPKDFPLQPQQVETNTYRGMAMTGGNVPTAQIPTGTTVTDIVDFMFANCEKAQELGLDRGNRQGQSDSSRTRVNENGFRQSVIFRIEPEVTVIGYENVSNVYRMQVVLHVRPYYTQAALLSELQPENAQEPDVQRRMVDALNERQFLRKRYEYLFTGRNTEVINLDIKYNLVWSAALPQLEGARRDIEAVQPNARLHSANSDGQYNRDAAALQVEAQTIRQEIRQGTERLGARQRSINDLRTEQNELRRQIATLGQADPTAGPLQARLNAIEGNIEALTNDQQAIRQNVDALRARIAGPALPQTDAEIRDRFGDRAGQRIFAEDDPFFATANRIRPVVSFHQGNTEIRNVTGVGFHGGRTRDKGLFGAVLEQLYAPLSGQFINIDITVKGDPYWLGQGNADRQLQMRSGSIAIPGRQVGRSGLPNFIDGDQCFLLTFRYPQGIGTGQVLSGEVAVEGRESTAGAPIFRAHDVFNGVYRVTKVSSNFAEGMFKQTLTAHVLPLIDIIKAFGFGSTGRVVGSADERAGILSPLQRAPAGPANQLPGAAF